MPNDVVQEVLKCHFSPTYFISHYSYIQSEVERNWVPFIPWPAQRKLLAELDAHRLVVILKARQLGCSWLVMAYCLHQALLHPAQTVLLFSRRDDEAVDLLTARLKGMHRRLPDFLKSRKLVVDNDHELEFNNGSRIKAFPAVGGDSYSASIAVLDEFDLVQDQDRLLASVKPTIDAGGRLIVLSRPDKSRPDSAFKRIWREAPGNGFHPVFIPWSARPGRDARWYESVKREIEARTGGLDELHMNYPATPEEALAPRAQDKRFPLAWLRQCFRPVATATRLPGVPAGFRVYSAPAEGRRYVIGADPAEGNPASDDSALTVLDADTGEEAGSLAAKVEPGQFASLIAAVAAHYHKAPALVERNNHGHAVVWALRESHPQVPLLAGDDGRPGWNATARSKSLLLDAAAEAFREVKTVIHGRETFLQLAAIDAGTLRAPSGLHDDLAISFCLALKAMTMPALTVKVVTVTPSPQAPPPAGIIWPLDSRGW